MSHNTKLIHTLIIPGKGFICGLIHDVPQPISNDVNTLLEADHIFRCTGFHALQYVKQILVRVAFLEGRDAIGYFRGRVSPYKGFDGAIPSDYTLSENPVAGISTYFRDDSSTVFRPAFLSELRSLICDNELLQIAEPRIQVSNGAGEFWFHEMQGNGGWVSNCFAPRLEDHVAAFIGLDGLELVRNSAMLQEMILEDDPLRLDI